MSLRECRHCGKTFQKPEHQRRHERTHTGDRPYVCQLCNRAFARQDALARHERVHQRSVRQQLTPSSPNTRSHTSYNESEEPFAAPAPAPAPASGRLSAPNSSGLRAPALHGTCASSTASLCGTAVDFVAADDVFTSHLIWPGAEDLFQSILAGPTSHAPVTTVSLGYPSPASQVQSRERFGDQAPSIGDIPDNSSRDAMHNVRDMVRSRSSTITSTLDLSNISSRFLDESLHMFFVKFIPVFPILHRPTFVFQECLQPLLLSAMAIGSLYLGRRDALDLGQQLWKLTHTALTTLSADMITHRGPFDQKPGSQLLVTSFLTRLYGTMSSDPSIRATSQAFASLGFSWAKQCGITASGSEMEQSLPTLEAPGCIKDEYWRRWVARTVQERALLAHYALDGLLIRTTGVESSERHRANRLLLQANEAAFAAQTADDFLVAMQLSPPQEGQPSFQSYFKSLLSSQSHFPATTPACLPFNNLVVLEGLQAIISDKRQEIDLDCAVVGQALVQLYHSLEESKTFTKHERLEAQLRWHAICLELIVETSGLGRELCARHGVRQQLWLQQDHNTSIQTDPQWPHTPDGRRALLHAVAIQELIEELPRGRAHAIHMPSALFSAATIYAAFCMAGINTVNLPEDLYWHGVVLPSLLQTNTSTTIDDDMKHRTRRFIDGEFDTSRAVFGAYRNLVYECNTMQKLFGCLTTQWGVSTDMGGILREWTAKFDEQSNNSSGYS